MFLKKRFQVISLYEVGTFYRIEFVFSFLFSDIFLFFPWIYLCSTFAQNIKTNIDITEMEKQ